MSQILPGRTGAGATVSFQNGNGPAVPIGTLQDMDGPSITVGEVESTRLNSVFKPYAPTLPEGEATLTIQHVSADPGVQALRALIAQSPVPVVTWTVTYGDGGTDVFPGFCKGYSIQGVENETIVTASCPIRMTGPAVFTPGAAPTT